MKSVRPDFIWAQYRGKVDRERLLTIHMDSSAGGSVDTMWPHISWWPEWPLSVLGSIDASWQCTVLQLGGQHWQFIQFLKVTMNLQLWSCYWFPCSTPKTLREVFQSIQWTLEMKSLPPPISLSSPRCSAGGQNYDWPNVDSARPVSIYNFIVIISASSGLRQATPWYVYSRQAGNVYRREGGYREACKARKESTKLRVKEGRSLKGYVVTCTGGRGIYVEKLYSIVWEVKAKTRSLLHPPNEKLSSFTKR